MSKLTKEQKLTTLVTLFPYIAELLEDCSKDFPRYFKHGVKQDVNRVVKHLYSIGEQVTDPRLIAENKEEVHQQYHDMYVFWSELIEGAFEENIEKVIKD